MTTMRDVARVAGVSAKTVSRVFNEDPHVTSETRERVQWAMRRLNYVPNLLARSFRAGADAAIGLAFPDIADPFFAAMTSSIEESLGKRDMAVVVTSIGYDPARESRALETLLRRQISGLIVAPVSRDQAYLETWSQRTPMVFVDRTPHGLSAVSAVEDDFGGAREAVQHLARHGHRRIAVLGVSNFVSTTRRRLQGYRSAVSELALDDAPELVCMHAHSTDAAAAEFVKLLATEEPPTAVFSVSTLSTMALILALQQAGRLDIAVVGFGDFPMADALVPAITVVDQDPARLGRVAVERIVELLNAPESADDGTPADKGKAAKGDAAKGRASKNMARRRTVLPVRLIPRGSGELPPATRAHHA
jgi:LacI family transcriptional regulator